MKTILCLAILSLISYNTIAQAGTPDYSFGDSGRTATRFQPDVVANCVATQKDGKIIAGGGSIYAHGFYIARYLTDGKLDSSFNHDGKLIGFIPDSKRKGDSYVTGITIQPDDKILVVGVASKSIVQNSFDYDFTVARYMPDGSRDLSFGEGGYVTTDIGTISDKSLVMTLQQDGKIIVAGTYSGDVSSGNAVVRYTADGKLDSSFGKDGILRYDFHYYEYNSTPTVIKSLANGKILIAGTDYYSGLFVLMQLKKNGRLDSSFGMKNGVTAIRPPHLLILCQGMALQKDGRIILAGFTSPLSTGIATVMARFNSDGIIDSSFGDNGFIIDLENNVTKEFHGVCVQQDDKIIAAGYYFKSLKTSGDVYVVRYTVNGKKDSTFGTNGTGAIVDFNKMGDGANAIALLPNGKIVTAGGSSLSYGNSSFGIVVYNNDESKDMIAVAEKSVKSGEKISAYPNPVNDMLTIIGLNSNAKYDLLMMNDKGNLVSKAHISGNTSYEFNVQNLSSGVYYLTVLSNQKTITVLKFIKE